MTIEEERSVLDRLRDLLHGDDVSAARELLDDMHPADQADAFDELNEDERKTMLSLFDAEGVADLFEHLDEDTRKEVVEDMPRGALAQVLDRVENDIAVDILHEMPPAEAVRTLAQMTSASAILPLLQHEDETAGGIMTRGYVALHKDMTVEEAIAFLRATKPVAEEAYYLYVLDGQNRLQGVVSLRQLIVADPVARIEDVVHHEQGVARIGLLDHRGDFGGLRHVGRRVERLDLALALDAGALGLDLGLVAEAVEHDVHAGARESAGARVV